MSQITHEKGKITTRDVTSGFVAYLHDGNGNSVGFWAASEQKARKKAQNHA